MNEQIEGRLAAIEVLLFSIINCMQKDAFEESFHDEKERAITGLLNNPTVSDNMHSIVEQRLKMYENNIFRALK